jgi:hypothetical protein
VQEDTFTEYSDIECTNFSGLSLGNHSYVNHQILGLCQHVGNCRLGFTLPAKINRAKGRESSSVSGEPQ